MRNPNIKSIIVFTAGLLVFASSMTLDASGINNEMERSFRTELMQDLTSNVEALFMEGYGIQRRFGSNTVSSSPEPAYTFAEKSAGLDLVNQQIKRSSTNSLN
ncbi:MAG: hypothetical protein ACE5GZ_00660 [Gammaproteobacteria bacterium]